MRKFVEAATAALLLIGVVSPAMAASGTDCDKSWSVYDINREGVLRGTAARQFYDDMQIRGIEVGKTKSGAITAKQYMKACTTDFWRNLEEESGS